jgi:UDP-glucose:(galactosyl)LPS alpha-1,2-glucosyltransferase
MNILVTLDRNYLHPLRIMLGSLFFNNPHETFAVYLVGDGLTAEDLAGLSSLCAPRHTLHPIKVPETLFAGAPVVRYYSRAMYYRLLAAQLLPKDLCRVLYLDPDILVIGPVAPLYETELHGGLMAAASHTGLLSALSGQVNRLRLDNYEAEAYFNSGVLVMDLAAMRQSVRPADIYAYAQEHEDLLILPDQDILNGLYGGEIFQVDDSLWNYDARKYERYWLTSQGEKDMDWVMTHTAILHFCGKNKPWNPGYMGYFSALYKHYQRRLSEL